MYEIAFYMYENTLCVYDNVNDDENLFNNLCHPPPGRFCIRLQEYAKGGWQVCL